MLSWRRVLARPDEATPPERPERSPKAIRRERFISIFGVAAFILISVFLVARDGLFLSTDTVLVWTLAALVALSLSDLRRVGIRLLWDWLPFGLVLILFHYAHGAAVALGTRTHSLLQIRFDEFIFGKPLLTVHLQRLFHQTSKVRWWEYSLFGVYLTYFFIALVVAAALWRFAYPRFREFRTQFITLSGLGCLTYVIYPADPPWLVSQQQGQLPFIYRVVYEVWNKVGLHSAGAIVEHGSAFHDQTAAVPSLHAGVTMLVCLFFWPIAKPWARALLLLYALAMAFTLIYSGEHYFFDIVTGWIYAGAVVIAYRYLQRRRARSTDPPPPTPTAPETAVALG
jgi:membrane-associated phospholipid phosphatase